MITRERILSLKGHLSIDTTNELLHVFDLYKSAMERVEKLSTVFQANDGLRATLSRQSTMLAEALKEKNDAITKTFKLANEIVLQGAEVAKLNNELKLLRPPDPKFRVGQVVMLTYINGLENAFTIRHAKLDGGNKRWWYANARRVNDIDWIPEDRFRALKNEEIG
jgi:hypothetical protein